MTPLARDLSRRQHRGTAAVAKLLSQILSEYQAALPLPNSKPCPSLRDRHPILLGLTSSAWRLNNKRTESYGRSPFSFRRRDFTSTVQGLLAPASLRSTLSRCGPISLGFSKKYSVVAVLVYERFEHGNNLLLLTARQFGSRFKKLTHFSTLGRFALRRFTEDILDSAAECFGNRRK